jgi:hypothetical protein
MGCWTVAAIEPRLYLILLIVISSMDNRGIVFTLFIFVLVAVMLFFFILFDGVALVSSNVTRTGLNRTRQ